MSVLAVKITENGRGRLGLTLLCLHIIQVVIGLICFIFGSYFLTSVNQKAHLVKGYNTKKVGNLQIAGGLMLVFLNVVGAIVSYECGSYKTRQSFQRYLGPGMIAMIVLCAWLLFQAALCFHNKTTLRTAFKNGMLLAMEKYPTDKTSKIDFDSMQMQYSCCGSWNYTDWFRIQWIRSDLIPPEGDKKFKKSELLNSVPFSCCNPEKIDPCHHRRVLISRSGIINPQLSLYQRGCADALMEKLGKILSCAGMFAIMPCFTQGFVVLLLRYLQTSIDDCNRKGDPRGAGRGMIAEECSCNPMAIINLGKKGSRNKDVDNFSDDESHQDEVDTQDITDESELVLDREPILKGPANTKQVKKDKNYQQTPSRTLSRASSIRDGYSKLRQEDEQAISKTMGSPRKAKGRKRNEVDRQVLLKNEALDKKGIKSRKPGDVDDREMALDKKSKVQEKVPRDKDKKKDTNINDGKRNGKISSTNLKENAQISTKAKMNVDKIGKDQRKIVNKTLPKQQKTNETALQTIPKMADDNHVGPKTPSEKVKGGTDKAKQNKESSEIDKTKRPVKERGKANKVTTPTKKPRSTKSKSSPSASKTGNIKMGKNERSSKSKMPTQTQRTKVSNKIKSNKTGNAVKTKPKTANPVSKKKKKTVSSKSKPKSTAAKKRKT